MDDKGYTKEREKHLDLLKKAAARGHEHPEVEKN